MNPLWKLKLSNLKIKIYNFLESLIQKILFLAEFLLFLRFLLKFFNANPAALVVNRLYYLTDFLIYPFNYIFPNFYWKNFFVEVTTLVAMVGYLLLTYFSVQVLRIIFQE